jgi:uncharacterized membrane protein YgcG
MGEKRDTVDLGKRQTVLLITLVSFLFVLALAGMFASLYTRGERGSLFSSTTEHFTGLEYFADGLIQPYVQVRGFEYYKNPNHFNMDYSMGPDGGSAVWNELYPYRATFFGAMKTNATGSAQGYDSMMYVLYSKTPTVNFLSFQYLTTRSSTGHIRATATTASLDKFGVRSDSEWVLMYRPWQGVQEGDQTLYTYNFTTYSDSSLPFSFDFDFVYMNEGNNNTGSVQGLLSIPGVQYGYQYYCTSSPEGPHAEGAEPGSPGGLPGGGSSSGGDGSSSGGGGSSGGDGSSSGGDGSSSGDDNPHGGDGTSSGDDDPPEKCPCGCNHWSNQDVECSCTCEDCICKKPTSPGGGSSSGGSGPPDDGYGEYDPPEEGGGRNPGDYPWEDDRNTPDLDWEVDVPDYPGGSEDDEGENGDTWELPEYDIPDPPFGDGDLNIPPAPSFDFPETPGMPEVNPPRLDYKPEAGGGWPPPFPGTN